MPGLVNQDIDDVMIASLVDAAIDYISKVTLEQVENAVIYLGSTLLSEDIIKTFVTKTESLYVHLVNYKSTEKLDTTFNWAEGKVEEDKNLDTFQYTVLYDKKYMKQATKLGRKVLLLTEKDVLAVLEATRQEKFTSSGLVKNIIVTICATQLHVPEKSVESWLSQQH